MLALILAATLSLEVPFVTDDRHQSILITSEIDGHTATMLVDTGAALTYVDASLTGISPVRIERAKFRGDAGLQVYAVPHRATLQFAGWSKTMAVRAANLQGLSQRYGRKIDGIIGQDVLRQFPRVTIDFEAKKLLLSR